MRYSDIKVGNIYFADLDPVRAYEFGGNHLSIVLSKGHDKRTVTIVSLTSNSSGQNKIDIGIIPTLPQRLIQDKDGNPNKSYVVLDQVRTVVANRVQDVMDGKNLDDTNKIIDCSIGSSIFSEIVHKLASLNISFLNDEEEVAEYHKNEFFHHCVNKMIDLTYDVIKGKGNVTDKKEDIKYLFTNTLAIDKDFSIGTYLNSSDMTNKVSEKISEIVLVSVK